MAAGTRPRNRSPQEPGLQSVGPTLDLEVRAIPKKPAVTGSVPLVANPVPPVGYWE